MTQYRIAEGQLYGVDGMLNGFGKLIVSQSTARKAYWHIGWFKENKPLGYGVGNIFTPSHEMRPGWYEYYEGDKDD